MRKQPWGKKVPAAAKGTTSKKIATIGGSYRFKPVTVYLQGQYFDGVNKLDGFSSAKNIKGFRHLRQAPSSGLACLLGSQ